MIRATHFVNNTEGWALAVKQTYSPEALVEGRRPVAIIPGYGMNAFIFGYHPTGPSMEEYWAAQGFEVWSINLRGQGGSKREGGRLSYGFYEVAVTDLMHVTAYILEHSRTKADRIDAVGCSLGGTYLYIHLACLGTASRLGSIVAIGAPLTWRGVHPLLRLLFGSPWLAGSIHLRGTRHLARLGLPLLKHFPRVLGIYLHPEIVDISKTEQLVKTVENPNPVLNRQIAEWMKQGHLVVNGIQVDRALGRAENPLLIVLANADGIVPEQTALSAYDAFGSKSKDILRVGTETVPIAHADLFISDYAQQWVFGPLAEWLIAHTSPAPRPTGTRPRKKRSPRRLPSA